MRHLSEHDAAVAELAALQQADRLECQASAETFVERHCSIEEPDGTVIPFRLWGFQRKTISTLTGSTLAIVLKARRLGLSWVALALALWMAIFQQGIRILILCKTEGDAAELLNRIRRMRDRILADPASRHLLVGLLRPAKTRDAVTALDIGASTIRALVGTPAAARMETAGLVIWDEAAFQNRAHEIWQGLLPTIEGGGRLWVISTGNGVHGIGATFAELWTRAREGLNGFAHLFWPWDVRPDRDVEWKQRQVAAIGTQERFRVEYPENPDDAFIVADATSVYSRDGIAAAVRLGAEFDQRRAEGTMPPPVDGDLPVTADLVDRRAAAPVEEVLDVAARFASPVPLAIAIAAGAPVGLSAMETLYVGLKARSFASAQAVRPAERHVGPLDEVRSAIRGR